MYIYTYQKVMRWGEERVTQMKLSGRWHKQPSHVHWEEVSAMAASDSDGLEQACARNTYLKIKGEKINGQNFTYIIWRVTKTKK